MDTIRKEGKDMTDAESRKEFDMADRDIIGAIWAAKRARASLADGNAHDAVTALMIARLQMADARNRLMSLEARAIDAPAETIEPTGKERQ